MKVELKKWALDDKKQLMDICNSVERDYLSDRLPYPYTEECADWWLNMVLEHDGKDGVFRAIEADGKIVGNISVEQKSDVYKKDAEIGYMLATEEWSRGIMTEAVKKICKEAFEELPILRITGMVYAPNTASRRVLEKNGFELEGIMKNAVVKNGRIYDLCIYGKSEIQIIPAYDFPQEVNTLFSEYTQMLVDNDPAFGEYLAIQNYEEELKHLREKYGMPEGRLYLAYCGGQLAGCIGLRKIDDVRCEMKRLYVRPEFRGKCIGSMLI